MSKRIFFVVTLFATLSATAQDTTATRLDEVVVTANKFQNKTALTGKVVVVITRQDLERAGSKDLAQVLTEQGGVYINGAFSNPGKDKSVYLRGAKVEHTLITVDGVPVYDATGIGSNFDIRNLSVDQVERIEILKGSQGTLYGSDAIAGVINIITRKNGVKPISAYGLLSAGSFNTFRGAAGVSGKKEKWDYHVGYSFFDTKGISEAEQPKDSTTPYDKDGYRQHSLQASIGLQATAGWRIQPYLRYSKNKGGYDQQGFVDAPNTYTLENTQAGIRNEIALGAGKLNVLYNHTKTARDYEAGDSSSYDGAEQFGEAYVVYPVGQVTITGGIDLRHSSTDQRSTSPYILPIGKDSAKQTQQAVYAALNFQSPDGFNLEAGGRYNHHSVYGSNGAFNFNPSYLVSNRWKLFANASSGYKTPSLYQLYSEYGNRSLNPERALNLEGGVQYFSKDGKATARATYFHRRVTDLIFFFYDPATFRMQYINQDKQRDGGVELDAKLVLADGLDLKLFYSYVDGEITTRSNGKDTTYFNLIRRPKSSAAVTLGYHFGRAYVSMQVAAFGKRNDVFYDPVTFERQDLTLDPYALINIYAEYGLLKKLKVFADLRNVVGERYYEIYGYGTPRFNGYGGVRLQF
jgi:vitamin B12 transporter